MSQTSSLAEVAEKLEEASNARAVVFVIRQPNQPDDAPSVLVATDMGDVQYNLLAVKEGIDESAENALEIIALNTNGKQVGDQGRVFLDQEKLLIAWDGPEKMYPDSNISDVEFSFSKDVRSNMLVVNRIKAADHFLDTLSPSDGTSVKSRYDSEWRAMGPDSLFREVTVQNSGSSVIKDMIVVLDFKPENSVVKHAELENRSNRMSWTLDVPEPTESNDNSADDGPGL